MLNIDHWFLADLVLTQQMTVGDRSKLASLFFEQGAELGFGSTVVQYDTNRFRFVRISERLDTLP